MLRPHRRRLRCGRHCYHQNRALFTHSVAVDVLWTKASSTRGQTLRTCQVRIGGRKSNFRRDPAASWLSYGRRFFAVTQRANLHGRIDNRLGTVAGLYLFEKAAHARGRFKDDARTNIDHCQARDPLRRGGCEMCCDHPAKRHSDKVRLPPAQRVEQRTHVSDVSVKAVASDGRRLRVPHVEGDCMNFVTQAQET